MSGQRWDPKDYARNAAFVPELGRPVVELLSPQPGERILDLGCGDGALTALLVEAGANVVGIDASPEFVEAARARGIDARLGDARALAFDGEFDAAFSNAALHWMGAPDAVLAGVARALRRGGRFAGEFGGKGNVAAIATALIAALDARGIDAAPRFPWHFPTVGEFAGRLRANGFDVEQIETFARPTPLPAGMRTWLETFANPFVAGMTENERVEILDNAAALLAPSLRDDAGNWTGDYVRLRFLARKR